MKDLAKYGLRTAGKSISVGPSEDSTGFETSVIGQSTSGVPPAQLGQPQSTGPTPADLLAGAPQTGSGLQRMPPDPMVWQNSANKRAESEVLNPARAQVLEWQHRTNNHDPSFDPSFDPVDAVRKSLTIDGTSLLELTDPPEDLMQSYELGFLDDWINGVVGLAEPSDLNKSETPKGGLRWEYSEFSWGWVNDAIVAYGLRIGMTDVQKRLHDASSRWYAENNARAIQHGAVWP